MPTAEESGTRLRPTAHPPSLQTLVEDRLAEAIVHGELADNERLTEVELADRLGVSRSPMRSAMQQLLHDGLLVRTQPRGVRVAPLDPHSARDFYDCRILLEGQCALLAASHLTDGQLARADELLAELGRARDANEPAAWLGLVEQLHDLYREACPNQELVAIIHGLGRRTLRLRAVGIVRPGRMDYSLGQHRTIVGAMHRRDGEALRDAVTDLLTTSATSIVEAIETGR